MTAQLIRGHLLKDTTSSSSTMSITRSSLTSSSNNNISSSPSLSMALSQFSESPILRTHRVRSDLNPCWKHTLQFSGERDTLVGAQLELKVYNWSRYFKPVLMGCKVVNISGNSSSKREDLWLELDHPSTTTCSTFCSSSSSNVTWSDEQFSTPKKKTSSTSTGSGIGGGQHHRGLLHVEILLIND